MEQIKNLKEDIYELSAEEKRLHKVILVRKLLNKRYLLKYCNIEVFYYNFCIILLRMEIAQSGNKQKILSNL